MTVKKINDNYYKLLKGINYKLKELVDINDDTLIYELSQEDIDEANYEHYIDCYDRHGTIYEMSVEKVYKNGTIYGYIRDLGTYWEVQVEDLSTISDRLTILNILNNENE
jgi:hypothetical protein